MWKRKDSPGTFSPGLVSVPLRGLIMWKLIFQLIGAQIVIGFSPLTGINYVETPPSET